MNESARLDRGIDREEGVGVQVSAGIEEFPSRESRRGIYLDCSLVRMSYSIHFFSVFHRFRVLTAICIFRIVLWSNSSFRRRVESYRIDRHVQPWR